MGVPYCWCLGARVGGPSGAAAPLLHLALSNRPPPSAAVQQHALGRETRVKAETFLVRVCTLPG